jgi:hypothetical protein
LILGAFAALPAGAREMEKLPIVKLQSLDKITARTMTFEAKVGSTVKFGPLYIKVQSCQKAPPVEPPESAAFLQIWQVNADAVAEWVFSGWMFASSPALSSMDHPIYDVWVLDCLERKSGEPPPPEQQAKEGEGELPASQVPAQPDAEKDGPPAPAPEPKPEPTSAEDGDLQME